MLARRALLSLVAALAVLGQARAENVTLTEAPLVGTCVRNELTLELKGKITVQQGEKRVDFPQEAQATHHFFERFLETGGTDKDRSARFYTKAEGVITSNGQPSKLALRPERAFLVAHRVKDQVIPYSPKGTLLLEEVEITDHFDTLAVAALVPGKELAVGAKWTLPNAVVAYLCDFDGLTKHDLEATLEEVKANQARIRITGSAEGIKLGALVKLVVTASYDFDVEAKRLVALEWKQSDQREQGPVTPAMSADVVIKLKREPVPAPNELSDIALNLIPTDATPPASLTSITYRDPSGRFELQHGREWHVTSPEKSERDQLVMRLMIKGFVAQATVTPCVKEQVPSLEKFAEVMATTPGWEQKEVTEQTELKDDVPGGLKVYRVMASGELDGVNCVQLFYLLMSAKGEQAIVTFTMAPTQVENLGRRDLELIRSFNFVEK